MYAPAPPLAWLLGGFPSSKPVAEVDDDRFSSLFSKEPLETEPDFDLNTEKQRRYDRHKDRQRQTDKYRHSETDRQRHTDRDIHTDRQTDRHTHTHPAKQILFVIFVIFVIN